VGQLAYATTPTTTTLSASPSPATVGGTVTLTATITFSGGGAPTGKVLFLNGFSPIGTGSVSLVSSNYQASFTTATLPNSVTGGNLTLRAIYTGDGTFASSIGTTSLAVSALGASSFSAKFTTLSPTAPTYIRAADVDHDGKTDLIISDGANINVYLGNGDGTFPTLKGPYTGSGTYFAVGDINGDGYPDILVAAGASGVKVLIGSSSGAYTAGTAVTTGITTAVNVALGDFNGDGKLDLAVADAGATPGTSTGAVVFYPGNGDGTFGTAVPAALTGHTLSTLTAIATTDVDGDGKADLVVGANDPTLLVLKGAGDGTFTVTDLTHSDYDKTHFFTLGDFNGDGFVDIAFPNTSNGRTILLNSGTGTFPTAKATSATFGANLFAGDFNGDGKQDLIEYNSSTVYVRDGTADGFVASSPTFSIASDTGGTGFLAVGDFNNDGRLDVASLGANSISIALAVAPTITGLSSTSTVAGSPAQSITITGTGYQSGDTVIFTFAGSAQPALTPSLISSTSLTVTIPSTYLTTAGSATIAVKDVLGAISSSTPYTVNPTPTTSLVSPTSAAVGTPNLSITVTGTNFRTGSTVTFTPSGGSAVLLTPTTYNSATSLTATIPAAQMLSVTSATISVTDPSGYVTNTQSFSVQAAPAISTLSVTSVPAGTSTFTLTINGSNFTSGSKVEWTPTPGSTTELTPSSITSSSIQVSVNGATLLATAASVSITVKDSNGALSGAQSFSVLAPTISGGGLNPSTTGVQASSGAGLSLVVTGANFLSGSTVILNPAGTPVTLTTVYNSPTQLTATVPASSLTTLGTVVVEVQNPGGQVSATQNLTVTTPVISVINPPSGIAGTSTDLAISITGTYFVTTAKAYWCTEVTCTTSPTQLNTTYNSPTSLSVVIPHALLSSASSTTQIQVKNDPATATTASNIVNFQVQAASITGLSPSLVLAGSPDFNLTITGSGFETGATVTVGGTSLTPNPLSSTQAVVIVPASAVTSAGNLTVIVHNPDLTVSSAFTLTVDQLSISNILPNPIIAGTNGQTITVVGTDFDATTHVSWTESGTTTSLTATLVDSSHLTANVPASLLVPAGTASVGVSNTISANTIYRGSATVNSSPQSVTISGPSITGLSQLTVPINNPSFVLTVTGLNFLSGSIVYWTPAGGTASPLGTTFISAGQLNATVPSTLLTSSNTATITVVNPATSGLTGATSNGTSLQVGPAPTISTNGVSPSGANAGSSDTTITITGTNFVSGSAANFTLAGHTTALATTYVSATQLSAVMTATLMATAGTGQISVTNPGNATSNSINFVIGPGLVPTVSTPLVPASVTVGSATFSLTVNGSNFVNGAAVQWNTGSGNPTALPTTFVNSTQVTALVSSTLLGSASTVFVSVVNPGGGTSSPVSFSINAQAQPTIATLATSLGGTNSVTAGASTFTLTVTGTNFLSTSAVLWNNGSTTTPLPTTYVDPTHVTALINSTLVTTAGSIFISVQNPGPSTSSPTTFTINPQGSPTITPPLSPASGAVTAGSAGFTLTVTGTNFVSGSQVTWVNGGTSTPLTTFYTSSTSLSALVPANLITAAATVSISVVNPGNVSSTPVSYTIAAPVTPTATAISPNFSLVNGAGFTMTVTGTNFVTGSSVLWTVGSTATPLATTVTDSLHLSAIVPSSLLTAAGVANVTVLNPGNVVTAPPLTFTIYTPPAILTSGGLSPSSFAAASIASGSQFQLIVTGSGFDGNSSVQWDPGTGAVGLTTTFISSTQLTAIVPGSKVQTAGSVTISVKNTESGSAIFTSNLVAFSITSAPVPTIGSTGVSPSTAVAGTATNVQILVTGTNFVNGAQVQWTKGSTTALATTFLSSTQLSATVTPALLATAGTANISVLNPDGGTSNQVLFTISAAPAPSISSLSQTSAVAGASAFTLVVTGANFTSGSKVQYDNGTGANPLPQLTTTFLNSGQLTAAMTTSVLSTAGNLLISVLNTDGSISNVVQFTISPLPAPTISSTNGLQPSSATQGGAAFTLIVNGSNFVSTSKVQYDDGSGTTPLPVFTTTFVSSTQLTAAVPMSALNTARTLNISVLNGSVVSNLVPFTISGQPTPQVATTGGLSPSSATAGAAQFQLTVLGANFIGTSQVQWNPGSGAVALPTTFISSTQLSAIVPATDVMNAGFATVTVLNSVGVVSNGAVFTINAAPTAPAPVIASSGGLSPLTAQQSSPTFQLLVSGSNFVSGAQVQWYDGTTTTLLPTVFLSSNELSATVNTTLLAAVNTIFVTVKNPGPTLSNSAIFTVTAPPPASISSAGGLSPNTATAGGAAFQLIVTGAGFTSASKIQWDSGSGPVPFAGTVFVNSTELTVNVPATNIQSPGTALVSVNGSGGNSNVLLFTITAGATPAITALSPATAVAHSSAFTMTVSGGNFVPSSQVIWNNGGTSHALTTTYLGATQLAAQVQLTDIPTSGSAFVSVTNPGNVSSNGAIFTITDAPAPGTPTITAVQPTSVTAGTGAFSLIVTGTNFDSGATVQWTNGGTTTSITNVTVINSTQLTATVGSTLVATAGSVLISVKNGSGLSSNVVTFPINAPAPPTITATGGLSPSTVVAGSGSFQLLVTGTNFASGASVQWSNGTTAQGVPTTVVSSTQITATVDGTLIGSPGTFFISVLNPNGGGQSNVVQFPVTTAPSPTILLTNGLNPATITAGSAAFQLTITGTNFVTGSVAVWTNGTNITPLTTTVLSASQLSAVVDGGLLGVAGPIFINVKNPGNSVSNVVTFTIAAPPGPTIAASGGLSPSSAVTGSDSISLTITGTNFVTGDSVLWGVGTSQQTIPAAVLSSTQIAVQIDKSLLTTAGTIPVAVQTAGSVVSNFVTFVIGAPPTPTISSSGLSPSQASAAGGAVTLIITGTNFVPTSKVQWDRNDGSGPTALPTVYLSSTQLSAVVGASFTALPVTAFVSVLNPGPLVSNSVPFIVGSAPTPSISASGISPATIVSGSNQFTLTVNGTNFVSGSTVNWGGQALQTTYVSSNLLTATVTAADVSVAGSILITVLNPAGGGLSNSVTFVVTQAGATTPPTINPSGGLSPASVTAGNGAFQLTVAGTNFVSQSKVLWDPGTGNPQTLSTSYVSATQLSAVVPAALVTTSGSAFVSVQTLGGSFAGTSNAVTFTISAPPPITINPASVQAGSAAFTVVVTGTNFPTNSVVIWNGPGGTQSLTTTFVDTSHVTAAIPASLVVTPGTAFMSVQLGPNSTYPTTNSVSFTITAAPLPTINSGGLSPASTPAGVGVTLIVTGTNFQSGAVIQFNGSSLSPTTFINSTQLTATVPASAVATAGSYNVTVINPNNGGSSNLVTFVVGSPVPTLASSGPLTPTSIAAGGQSFSIVVTGTGFTSSSVVQWNAGTITALQTVFIDSSHLQGLVASSLITSPGTALVSVSNGTGAVSNAAVFTITSTPLPSIATPNGLSPASIVAGGPAFTLSVSGNNFTPTSIVQWNGGSAVTNLTTSYIGAGQLTAIVPSNLIASASTVFVTVMNTGNLSSNPVGFTVSGATAPQILPSGGLSVSEVVAGSPAQTITITGANFIPASIVQLVAGSTPTPLTTAYLSSNQLTALIPASLLLTAGTAFLEVQNATGVVSNLVPFTIDPVPAPSISNSSGISPAQATTGSSTLQITITGSGFQSTSAVLWNTGSGPQTLVTGYVSNSSLTAIIPASLMTAPAVALIQVQNADKQLSNAVSFPVVGPSAASVPTVASIAPTSAPAGSAALQITVTGTNFTTGTSGAAGSVVQWNGTALPTTVISSTQLSATVAASLMASPGNNYVNVANSATAQSNGASFTVGGPTITSLNPATTSAGGPAFSLSVLGTNFVSGTVVTWNGTSLPTTYLSATQVTAQVSAAQIATATTAVILVANPGGAGSNPQIFTVSTLTPTVSALAPNAVPAGSAAFQLVVTGSNFQTGSVVIWNGSQLPTTYMSATQLNALVDSSLVAGAGTVSVIVQNPGPATSGSVKFTVGAPAITTVCLAATTTSGSGSGSSSGCTNTYPALGPTPTGPGIQLTITGTNFLAGSSVQWNGTPLPTLFTSATQLTAYVSASLLSTQSTVSVTVSNPGGAVSAASTFIIGPFTLAITTTSFPDAVVGLSYGPIILGASGGTPPYTWSITNGTIPAGLSLDASSGTIRGTATAAGPVTLGITVTDSQQRTATRTLPINVVAPLTISTASTLTAVLANSPVSVTFAATGGTAPYHWSTSGNVPPGLTVDPGTGLLSGSASAAGNFQFNVTVTDSGSNGGQTATKLFNLQVAVPDLTIGGVGAAAQPATQPAITVGVSSPYTVDITGTLTVTFASAVGTDDPAIAFSGGGRTVNFVIPAGATSATFSQSGHLTLSTGTVAGVITIKASMKVGGLDVTPNPAPQLATTVAKLAPVITKVTVAKTSSGVTVTIVGYSTTREATQAAFTFNAASGATLSSSTQTVNLASTFTAWYQSSASAAYGSQFTLSIPFSISGDLNAIGSVTVAVTNSIGVSAPVTGSMQ
jgi:hypothetical protein